MAKNNDLIRVEISKGRFAKMHKQDAIAKGYIKMQPQVENKMIQPQVTKRVEKQEVNIEDIEEIEEEIDLQDFTDIPGIGENTAQKIRDHDIKTFKELEYANWDFLSKNARNALEEYFGKDD